MEQLPVPVLTSLANVFGSVYGSVSALTGSSLLATIFFVILSAVVLFLLWQLGKWMFGLFSDDSDKVVKYYDATGRPVAVTG